jgi:hypothetical protein
MVLLKALPELISAAILLDLWLHPLRFGTEWFRAGVLTLLLEFFVIHSSGFMAVLLYDPEKPKRKRALQVGGLAAGYLLFMSAFAWGFDAWWMLLAFAWLSLTKILGIWSGTQPIEKDRYVAISSWALSIAVYLAAVAATAIMEDVPQLGVTEAIRDAAGFNAEGGVWEASPWRALAGGVVYYAVMALSRPLFALWRGPSLPAKPQQT